MIVSVAEEMNPTRRNTMEDAHVVHPPGSWGAPDDGATFLGVYDGHGGRLIADYLEDHLAENVAAEWAHCASERKKEGDSSTNDDDGRRPNSKKRKKKRRLENDANNNNNGEQRDGSKSKDENDDDEDEVTATMIRTAMERAFLLTDVRSRMDGIVTSGATAACCVVTPELSSDGRNVASISVHAANAGDARAVLSSRVARRRPGSRGSSLPSNENDDDDDEKENVRNDKRKSKLPRDAGPPSESSRPLRRDDAVRITRDHKSTDPDEIARIESCGGVVIRGRVLGVLAVARSLGDHGLKEYVVGRPHLSSTRVRILPNDDDDDGDEGRRSVDAAEGPHTDGEFLIVACDGLWDVVEDGEAVDFVRDRVREHGIGGRERAANFLVEEALRRGSTDNITAIVYWL